MTTRLIYSLLTCFITWLPVGSSVAGTADWGPAEFGATSVAPGEKSKFPMLGERGYEASFLNAPVFVARGKAPGPTLCLTAAVHGDETNSVEIARRAFAQTDADSLNGMLYVLPVVNADGFQSGLRYLPDGRDLNRSFPGNANGSVASLIAFAVFSTLSTRCDALIDLHTGSNLRSNLPQIRVDLANEPARKLAVHFGVGIILGSEGPDGSLRREMMKAGIPAIIYEAGGPLLFQEEEVVRGTQGVMNAMAYLGMIELAGYVPPVSKIYEDTKWIRVPRRQGGFYFPEQPMGAVVEKGTRLGIVVDPITDEEHVILSPYAGQIIGMALPQPVLSGSPLIHLGLESPGNE